MSTLTAEQDLIDIIVQKLKENTKSILIQLELSKTDILTITKAQIQ